MPRKKGSANADHADARRALVAGLRAALFSGDPDRPPSLRALATAAGVSVPTLKHYFGDREGVFAAVFADCLAGARRELDAAATPSGPFDQSIADWVRHVADGFRYGGLAELHAVGLAEGFASPAVAAAYLVDVLEPTIDAARRRLETHIARGDMRPADARHAAIALVAPVVLAFLHQSKLGGAADSPLDLERFLDDHARAFVAARRAG